MFEEASRNQGDTRRQRHNPKNLEFCGPLQRGCKNQQQVESYPKWGQSAAQRDTQTQAILQSPVLARSVECNSAGNLAHTSWDTARNMCEITLFGTETKSNRQQKSQENTSVNAKDQDPNETKTLTHNAPTSLRSRQPTDLGQRVEQVASYQDGLDHATVQDKVKMYRRR